MNNHARVRVIFDSVQVEITKKPAKSYLVANLTRWTTHFVALDRLEELKQSLRAASLTRRDDIIAAQVGAAVSSKARELRADAEQQLDLIDDSDFWKRLSTLVNDIEPIAFATNICQSDHARPDTVLLAFVGMFHYFSNHQNRSLAREMVKRLERRWKALNQELMVVALLLNPFERISVFGPKANVNPFTLNALVTKVFLYSNLQAKYSHKFLAIQEIYTSSSTRISW